MKEQSRAAVLEEPRPKAARQTQQEANMELAENRLLEILQSQLSVRERDTAVAYVSTETAIAGSLLLFPGVSIDITGDALFAFGERFVAASVSVGGFLSGVVYDAGAAVAVIFGVLRRKLIVETGSLIPLLVRLVVAVLILSRLISNYHRTRATE